MNMIEYKNIINYILDNVDVTMNDLMIRYKLLFTETKKGLLYGIQNDSTGFTITHMDDTNGIKRYETKITKQIQC
jgi:hypothetical protein